MQSNPVADMANAGANAVNAAIALDNHFGAPVGEAGKVVIEAGK